MSTMKPKFDDTRQLNWDSQQGRDLATSGCNKKNQSGQSYSYTDKNNLDKSYKLAKNFLDFPLWEKRIAYFK